METPVNKSQTFLQNMAEPLKKEIPRQPLLMGYLPKKITKNLSKTNLTLSYNRAAADEPPASANMRALNTS